MIFTSSLTTDKTLRVYRIVFGPSITYPMGAIYFSPPQCCHLQNIAAQSYLPKLGFNKKLPKAILYGPAKYGGWVKKELCTHLAIQQTKLFLGHLGNQDDTANMLLGELDYTQQVSGLVHSILNKETSPKFINWMPNTWITDYKKI